MEKRAGGPIGVIKIFFVILMFVFTLRPHASHPATFEVSPLRFLFSGARASDILQIKNESDGKLQVQIKSFEWKQDTEGKDVYSETTEVIFFPRILTLQRGEARIVRVGMKTPPGRREKTYRMFIEEMPGEEVITGTAVRTLLRLGIPVFLAPSAVEMKAGLDGLRAEPGGKVSFRIKNEGNVHFVIRSIKIVGQDPAGTDLFKDESQGWYLHAGASRAYAREIPKNVCAKLSRIQVEVTTDKPTLTGATDVQKGICTP